MLTQSTCTITVLFLTNSTGNLSVLLCTDTLYLYNLQYCLPVLSTESVISQFYEISYSLATYISEVRPGICSLKPNPSSVERLTSLLFPSWSDLFRAPRLTLSSHRMAGKDHGAPGKRSPLAWSFQDVSGCLGLACCPDRFFFVFCFFKHMKG